MYSLGIFGSCFWNRVFKPVRIISERGCASFSTGTMRIIPFRSSTCDGFSGLLCGYTGIIISLLEYNAPV